ncbi:MAG: NADH-quinone oxidoreductase subunit J, partial [Acidobacteriota bacterium]|nr:NADH-quinone oxidoreductase subunit J [Acidobacteriota bacterium]
MLLNLQPEARGGPGYVMLLLSLLLGAALIALLARAGSGFDAGSAMAGGAPLAEGFGTSRQLGSALFEVYFYPFEIVSLALVAAMIGAVLMAKRYLEG